MKDNFENIPDELKVLRRWVIWQNPAKSPITPAIDTSGFIDAKSNDPSTWRLYQEAIDAYQFHAAGGIGIMLGKLEDGRRLCGLDYDLHYVDGQWSDFAINGLKSIDTYSEWSPGGRGLHQLCWAEKPNQNHSVKVLADLPDGGKQKIEIYDRTRFFTMTGNIEGFKPRPIRTRQHEVESFYHSLWSTAEPQEPPPHADDGDDEKFDDDELLRMMTGAKNRQKFNALWHGNIETWIELTHPKDSTKSGADAALLAILAYWTDKNVEQMERMFKKSALWTGEKSSHYLDHSIKRTCEFVEETFSSTSTNEANVENELRNVGGVFQEDDHYYKYVKRGDEYLPIPISSFIIDPKLRIWLDGKENFTVDFVTHKKTYADIVIHRRDWNGRDRFMDAFPSADLQWNGSLNDVQNVLGIVASYDVPIKQGTTQLGRQESGIWLLPNMVFDASGYIEDSNLIYMPRGGKGEFDEKISVGKLENEPYNELLNHIYSNIFFLNLPSVIIPIIGWFMATPFKPLIQQKYRGFPLLSISGRTGAGKSSLLDLIWKLVGISGKLFSCTETDFVMLKLLSSTTSIPLVFDEYKPFDIPPLRLKSLTRMLRKCYDGENELRGKADQTTIEYSLSAPVAIAGEVPLTEGALLERIIHVSLSKNKLNDIMRKAYEMMCGLNLAAFMSRYIPFCLNTNFDRELNQAEVLATDLIPGFDNIADRVQKNLTVMTFGFNQFMRFGKEFDIDCGDLTPALAEALTTAKNAVCGEEGIAKDALDYMFENLAVMAETKRLESGRDYIIREHSQDIALRFASCFAEFRKFHRETQLDGELLNAPAYKGLLKENHERSGYVTETQTVVRFGTQLKRAAVINPQTAEAFGIDLSGFLGNEN